MALRPAVFLDRDGTLNVQVLRDGRPFAAASLEEFRLFEGVPEACRALKAAGFLLVVVTNQPDVGRGTISEAVVDAMHARLRKLVPEIDRVEACYDSGRGEASLRRKPEPGMILDAAFGKECRLIPEAIEVDVVVERRTLLPRLDDLINLYG